MTVKAGHVLGETPPFCPGLPCPRLLPCLCTVSFHRLLPCLFTAFSPSFAACSLPFHRLSLPVHPPCCPPDLQASSFGTTALPRSAASSLNTRVSASLEPFLERFSDHPVRKQPAPFILQSHLPACTTSR